MVQSLGVWSVIPSVLKGASLKGPTAILRWWGPAAGCAPCAVLPESRGRGDGLTRTSSTWASIGPRDR